MLSKPRNVPHVVSVGVDLDPTRGTPSELIQVWDDFGGHLPQAAAASNRNIRASIVQASWYEEESTNEGIPCHFVRENQGPPVGLPGGRVVRMLPLRLCARVRELAPDIVHFSGLGFSRELWALRAAIPRVPIVAQAHATRCLTVGGAGICDGGSRGSMRPYSVRASRVNSSNAPG